MNRIFSFFFSLAVSIVISKAIVALDIPTEIKVEHKKKINHLEDSTLVAEPNRKRSKSDHTNYPSLKEYLKAAENSSYTNGNDKDDLEQARQATQLTLEDEGILPEEDSSDYEE